MQSDLTRYFGYVARKEKVKVKVLALKALNVAKMAYRDGDRALLISDTEIRANQVTVKSFLETLDRQADVYYRTQSIPLIDETNYDGVLGKIEIETDIFDYQKLNKALRNFGMQLELKEIELEMLIISKI